MAIAGTTFLNDGIANRNGGVLAVVAINRAGTMVLVFSTASDGDDLLNST